MSLNGINIVVVITGWRTQCVIDLANLKLFMLNFIVSSKIREVSDKNRVFIYHLMYKMKPIHEFQ